MSDKLNYTVGVPKDKPYFKKAFVLFHLLDTNFRKLELQKSRIRRSLADGMDVDLVVLFADIHFFLVSLSSLYRILNALRAVVKNEHKFGTLFKQYRPQLEYLDKFRDHLEHIEDRLDGVAKGKPLKNPSMFGNLFGDEYDFGGERFNIKHTFALIDDLEKDLAAWNESVQCYPLWQPTVIKKSLDDIVNEFRQYFGFLMYSLDNCKRAFEDLGKHNKALNEGMKLTNNITGKELNELGRLDRVLKDYIILKVANLFDRDSRTLSLLQLQSFLEELAPVTGAYFSEEFRKIRNEYREHIALIRNNRNKVVAHTESKEYDSLMHTHDLLAMPLVLMLKALEGTLVQTGHKLSYEPTK